MTQLDEHTFGQYRSVFVPHSSEDSSERPREPWSFSSAVDRIVPVSPCTTAGGTAGEVSGPVYLPGNP